MAKPRNSVLYMFDPLHQAPSTPRRDSSDDLGPSDKENDTPPGDLTIFFNRTYAAHKQPEANAFIPMGKLIDIGDTPAPSRIWDAAEHDGSDPDGEQSESDAESCGVVSPPRVPLAELDVEHTPRPQLGGRAFTAPVFVSPKLPSHDSEALQAMLVPAPSTSPLAEVINSINFSAMSISEGVTPTDGHYPTQEPCEVADSRPSSPFPEINVCAPQTPCVDKFDISANVEVMDIPVATSSHLRPSATLTQLSPDDPRRASVDLQSSFHLQMQSAEMSFDLLNDKVSFFGNGQDSFWSGGDDTLDFSEICVPPAMKAKLEALVPAAMASRETFQPVFSPPTKASPTFERSPVMSPTTETAVNVPLPLSPVFSTPSSRNVTPPRVPAPNFQEPPSPPTSPVVADEPSLLLESEPLPPPMPAPPVPALRIIKKTFKVSSHQSTAQEPANSKPAGIARVGKEPVLKRRLSLATAKPASVSASAAQPARPPIRGVQRPPAGMQVGGLVIGMPSHGVSSNASTASTSSSGSSASARPARAVEAAAPASRFAGIQRPNLAAKERAAPATHRAPTSGPRSTTLTAASARGPSARTTSMPKPVASVIGSSALRPPSRIAAPGSTALPKPASRLPGLTRTASMSSGSSAAGNGTAASRARASTFSRATGRF
ncbi:hypothetical protein L226DRAFT_571144 [Lentinus tigrinus ALCF2SS1-7]|uniref:Uncharacterized protein n=1 Tax=Lentinus tigrinus ALCF2SS1-6 TaxID=1328759 RepID=A0A5C2SFM7_9APHY|nr:hypothetical protein L227DRAFT_611549 [Lentinus tigrinus ALCF2SS1-6]RPD74869.1 hypothetical protein L226DRAFT_571144 [Lentinus tigrinus ALCF2SS1-7]